MYWLEDDAEAINLLPVKTEEVGGDQCAKEPVDVIKHRIIFLKQ